MRNARVFGRARAVAMCSAILCWGWVGALLCRAQTQPSAVTQPTTAQADASRLPAIFLAGDSTAAQGSVGAIGWGRPFAKLVDPEKARSMNLARGGRSSRTFVTEGLWDKLAAQVKPGDYVLIQFGQNDGGAVDTAPFRGSLKGLGEETQEVDNSVSKVHETIHTFGWYMKKMVEETKAKGGTPILLSLTVRDIWKDGKVERGSGQYGEWTKQVAVAEKVAFVDLTTIMADRYEQMGEAEVKPLFPRDTTHTSDVGAELNARGVVAGLKALHRQLIDEMFSTATRDIDPAPQEDIVLAHYGRPAPGDAHAEANFLNVVHVADPSLPSVVLIGDSTVRNGRGDGIDGQWGWGDALGAHFDPAKVNVVNRALGGTGARSFMQQWPAVLEMVKKGDIVLMQFGHNDNGARGALKGVGEETEERAGPGGQKETVHTFGWYLRKYVADVRAKGATPVICTLIPRNTWKGDKMDRPTGTHADWARAVAKDQNIDLVDLNNLIADRYDALGKAKTTELFASGPHTTHAGAELNAACVIEGLKALPEHPIDGYLRATPATTW